MRLEAYRFPVLLAGTLSLNFSNTAEFRISAQYVDFLPSYEAVLAWCWNNKLINTAESQRLLTLAQQSPLQANASHITALALRETIYRLFTAVIDDETPSPDDLARLNDMLNATPRRVVSTGDQFAWAWVKSDDLAQILAPIALAAAELLTSDQLEQVRQCPNCGWLFVDTSRNHSRRWCSMDFCGSKMKSRRQYERRKSGQGQE
jgi:predicted RNA-binding Zn ribbon-like protein